MRNTVLKLPSIISSSALGGRLHFTERHGNTLVANTLVANTLVSNTLVANTLVANKLKYKILLFD
jgi:hypothetical protein